MKFHYDEDDKMSLLLHDIEEGYGMMTTEEILVNVIDSFLEHYENHIPALKIDLEVMRYSSNHEVRTIEGEWWSWCNTYHCFQQSIASGLDAIPWSTAT